MFTLFDLCVSSLRRGHANLLCIVPFLTDDPRRESIMLYQIMVWYSTSNYSMVCYVVARCVIANRSTLHHITCSSPLITLNAGKGQMARPPRAEESARRLSFVLPHACSAPLRSSSAIDIARRGWRETTRSTPRLRQTGGLHPCGGHCRTSRTVVGDTAASALGCRICNRRYYDEVRTAWRDARSPLHIRNDHKTDGWPIASTGRVRVASWRTPTDSDGYFLPSVPSAWQVMQSLSFCSSCDTTLETLNPKPKP